MRPEKIVLTAGIILAAALAMIDIKHLFFLSFTLLSLKVVWMALIIFFIFSLSKKKTEHWNRPRNTIINE